MYSSRRFSIKGASAALLSMVLLAGGSAVRGQIVRPPDLSSEVSIEVKVPTAYAAAGIPASFVITRTAGDTPGGVTVNYQVSGRATPGQDYVALKGTRYIDGTQSQVTVRVHPLVVPGTEGTVKGVRVTLLPGAGYALTSEVAAKVQIVQ